MSSKDIAKKLVAPLLDHDVCFHDSSKLAIPVKDLLKLQNNIEKFLKMKFDEGVHVGRDHYEKE